MELPQKIRNIILVISLLTLVCGIIVMSGWLFNLPLLQSFFTGQIAMKFNAGLCFAFLAISLLCLLSPDKLYNSSLHLIFLIIPTAIGLITFSQDVFGFNCGIDTLFLKDNTPINIITPHPGRMALNASLGFTLLGVGMLINRSANVFYKTLAQYFFHLVSMLSAIAMIGFLYGVSLFQSLFYVTAMPLYTAILFFIVSIAASLFNSSLGISQIFTGKLVGNQMARRLFLMIILVVIFMATLRNQTREMGLFTSKDIGVSLLAVCFLFMSLLLIWNTAVWLNKIDIRRQEAEEKVMLMNTQLEKLVEERSAELRDAELKFKTIADKSMVGVYIVQHNAFSYVNPRFAQVFGYQPADLVNKGPMVEMLFPEEYRAIVRDNLRKRLSGEVESIHYEVMGQKKDGTTTWVEIYGNAVVIGGEPAIIGSMIDITERKQAEEEMRLSEQKYKLLFESNPMPLWMIDKDNLSIIDANEAAARHYGYSREELVNLNMRSFRPPEDSRQQMEGYQKEIDGDMGIVRHYKKDGSMILVQVIAHDIIFEGKHVRLSMTNDVTERLQAEESLQKSEANLQAILRTTDTAYALFDRNLNVLACNQKSVEFTGELYGHHPDQNKHFTDYLPLDRFPDAIQLANDVLKGNNVNFEKDFVQPDGSVSWYYVRLFPITNEHKAILGVLMAMYDITERKNTENDLKTAYSRIQSHINNIKDMAWKQSHLIRSPLANLKGLASLLQGDVKDKEVLKHIQSELDRMDSIIIEMAEDVSEEYYND